MGGPPIDKSRVKHLVVGIHGIRTRAEWKDHVRDGIELDADGIRDNEIKFEMAGYGYFDVVRFMLPIPFANGIVERIHGKILGFKNEYRNAERLSIVAHSFGTYVIAKILMRYSLRVDRLILCASVIPDSTTYWNAIRKSVNDVVRNDCSRDDIWPALAHAIWWYGNTGNFGAQFPGVEDIVHSFRNHSAFLTREFAARYWRSFLVTGVIERPEPVPAGTATPWKTSQLPVILRVAQFAILLLYVVVAAGRTPPLAAIPSGTVGILSGWNYELDTDEAIVEVQSSRNPRLVGHHYVVVVMKKPADDTPVDDEVGTVVSKIQKVSELGAHVDVLRIPCGRIARQIEFGDSIRFLLYVIRDEDVNRLKEAIAEQANQPVTVRRLCAEFGGIKAGSGGDGATFKKTGVFIEAARPALEELRKMHSDPAR